MPKRFSENEKVYITKRLKEEAMNCLITYGVKKTTVDELVKRVNIPKGTFYLFYGSKEQLLFDVINDMHDELQHKLLVEMEKISGHLTVDRLTDFLLHFYMEVNDTGLLSVMMSNELELLIRKLPEETVKDHLAHDNLSMEKFFSFLPFAENKNIPAFGGALRGVFLTSLYKREIGEELYTDALRLMIRGIVIQIMKED